MPSDKSSIAASRGTPLPLPRKWNCLPSFGTIFLEPSSIVYYIVLCLGICIKRPEHEFFLTTFLNYYVSQLDKMLEKKPGFGTRMEVILKTRPTGQLVLEHLKEQVQLYIDKLRKDKLRPSKTIGVVIHPSFGLPGDEHAKHRSDIDTQPQKGSNDFQDLFDAILLEMFPSAKVQQLEADAYFSNQRLCINFRSVGFSDIVDAVSYPPQESQESYSLDDLSPSEPISVDDDETELVLDPPMPPTQVLSDSVETTQLLAAIAAEEAVQAMTIAQDLTLSAKVVTAYHLESSESKELLEQSIVARETAERLAEPAILLGEVATAEGFIDPKFLVGFLKEHTDAAHLASLAESLECLELISNMSFFADSGKTDTIPPGSSKTSFYEDPFSEDADSAELLAALEEKSGPPSHHRDSSILPPIQKEENWSPSSIDPPLSSVALSPLHSIEIGCIDPPFSSVALSPLHSIEIGGIDPPFSNVALSPLHSIEIGVPFEELKSILRNSESILPTITEDGTTSAEYPDSDLLLSIRQDSFPPPHPQNDPSLQGTDMGVGGAQSSEFLSEFALHQDGVGWNPHANQSPFPLEGDVGDHLVQVFALPEIQPRKSDDDDPPVHSSSNAPGSAHPSAPLLSFQLETGAPPALLLSLPLETAAPPAPPLSLPLESAAPPAASVHPCPLGQDIGVRIERTSRAPPHLRTKPLPPMPNPDIGSASSTAAVHSCPLGQEIGGGIERTSRAPQHLRNKPLPPMPNPDIGSASSTAAVQCCPLGQDIGGFERPSATPLSFELGIVAPPVQPSSNPPGPAHPSATLLSFELETAAPSTAAVHCRPLGQEMGVTKRSGKQVDIGWLLNLGVQLPGVPPHELNLFSHLSPMLFAEGAFLA